VIRLDTRSARGTSALGERLGALLAPGDVVALVGDLGAGKTQLVRGACAGAGVRPSEVSSPSFAIVATYAGRIPVHHADLYRIGDEDELYGTGFGDLVGGEGALLVEWADRIPSALPAEKLTIRLAHDDRRPDVRHVELEGVGERHAELARTLGKRGRGPGPRPRPGPRPEAKLARSRSKSKTKSRSTTRTRARKTRTNRR
jgi:tRNA threonylcarbamoyladenosine biosynthesis protein TsaE